MTSNSIFNIYIIIINIISFLIYAIDKIKSIKHEYRVPENVLLILSLFGGAIGSLLSMMLFHHKTRKVKFLFVNSILTIIWLYIII